MTKQLLFSLTEKDFDFSFFAVGGAGGGGKDTSNTGVRCIHRASRAQAVSTETRSQRKNKETAFARCCKTKEFLAWHRLECLRKMSDTKKIEEDVEKAMQPENLKIEYL